MPSFVSGCLLGCVSEYRRMVYGSATHRLAISNICLMVREQVHTLPAD